MSPLPKHIFRGYDIRAIADTELTDKNVELIAKAYATFLSYRRINELALGHDNRLSFSRIKKVFIRSLLESGINVHDIGLSLSQIVYYSSYHFRAKGGVMITASHNPSEYNGFKLGVGFSDTLVTDEIQQLYQIAKSQKFVNPKTQGKLNEIDIFPDYKKDLLKRVSFNHKFKVVVDSGNGPTGKFLPDILREAGCQVIEQNTDLDGSFPLGAPDPTESEVLERLAKTVVSHQADLGFAYDADGDRIGIVDGNGRAVWNDILVAIFAKDIIHHLPGAPIVYNTLCSKVVSDVIKSSGGQPIVWLTGHSFIKAKVKEVRSPFGGELSGHFFFMDNFYGHDDGAFTSLRLLSYLSENNLTLAQAIDALPQYISSPEIKFGLADDIKFDFVQKVLGNEFKKLYPQAQFLEIDGIRMDLPTQMAIIRASQNGPYITLKFEGKTQTEYNQLKHQLKHLLASHPEVDFQSGVNVNALD